ncbi:cadherin-related family member 5 [Notolabrus celidotus]|uniref:cadherin-related family member 5 n=1 Tax=Notolabrus celidotus TaxID=1203425 RepID=UPI00148FC691|nr:cadherin-related family member 5 [Notolabrus celidotus]
MDGVYPHSTVRTCLSFLLLVLLQTSAEAQQLCSGLDDVTFRENNTAGHVLGTFTTSQPGVTLSFLNPPPDNPFTLNGAQLIANRVFDLENNDKAFTSLRISCSLAGDTYTHNIYVSCLNINDNPPNFSKTTYDTIVPEMSPVGTAFGPFEAKDLDGSQLKYRLTSDSSAFTLQSDTSPNLVVQTLLDFDKVKSLQVTLEAVDKALQEGDPIYTATATINIAISDVDNRPPWFQPCTQHESGGALICQSVGYTGRVDLNQQEEGVLPLKPGPIHAIDGDSGINAEITYSFLGYTGDLFAISPTTGNITMLKPADVVGTISLAVVAAQKVNSYQFATTTVSLSVQVTSLHPPKFQKTQYTAVISSVGSMAVDSTGQPLQFVATDADYDTTRSLNPYLTYSITGSSGFSIINGYLFMTKELPDGTLSLQVVATDRSNDESAVAQLSVEVKTGLTTTSLPLSTTDSTATPFTEESTTDSKTTGDTEPTSNPSMTTDGSVSTATPSLTSEGGASTASTAHPPTVIVPSGGYGSTDMAALGATLGVLLFICLIVIVVLILRVQRGNSAWKKIYETSMFRSTLGQGSGGPKETVQYTNDAFMDDEDRDSPGPDGLKGEPMKASRDFALEEAIGKSTVPPHALLRDDVSLSESDKADDPKPILTKERRSDDGYKSVWFKEDIDPNAKEEVVIIPDSREDDSEDDEEESSGKEENEDDNQKLKTPRVGFIDTDLDSGLGVKIEDPGEDSESGEVMTSGL